MRGEGNSDSLVFLFSLRLKLNTKMGLNHHHHHPPPQTFLHEGEVLGLPNSVCDLY